MPKIIYRQVNSDDTMTVVYPHHKEPLKVVVITKQVGYPHVIENIEVRRDKVKGMLKERMNK